MPEKVSAQVRSTTVEYRGIYDTPLIARSNEIGRIEQATFEAFGPWNISLEQVSENLFPANLSQSGVVFQVLGRYTFKIGIGAVTLSAWNLTWEESEAIVRIGEAGTDAVRKSAEIEFSGQEATLDMHLTPQSKSVSDFTGPLTSPTLVQAAGKDFVGAGFVLHRQSVSWYMDVSAMFEQSIYLRIVRKHSGTEKLSAIASRLREDEAALLNHVGLIVEGINS